jgi:hypothetical protein
MDATSGVALDLKTGVPTYQVEDEEGGTHLLLHLTIEEENELRWCLWRPDSGRNYWSVFNGVVAREIAFLFERNEVHSSSPA